MISHSEPDRFLRYSPAYQFQWKCIGVIGSVGRQAGVNQTGGRECEKSPAVCSARDFHPLSSAGRNMCLCFILFCASSALSSLPPAAPALLALADGSPITAEREQTNIGERVLNCPHCLMTCQALKFRFDTGFFTLQVFWQQLSVCFFLECRLGPLRKPQVCIFLALTPCSSGTRFMVTKRLLKLSPSSMPCHMPAQYFCSSFSLCKKRDSVDK